jgi:AraC-like DNA-binding protein
MNKQFDKSAYKQLLNSEGWKLVCSELPPDAGEVKNHAHKKWLQSNSDSHPQREILLALKGSTTCSLNGKCYKSTPGTLFLFGNFEKHDQNYFPDYAELEHLWLYLVAGKIIARIIKFKNNQIKNIGQEYIIDTEHLFLTLHNTWNKLKTSKLSNEFKRKKLISALSLIFLEIAEQDIQGNPLTPTKNHQARIITMIKEHIKDTSGKGLSIDRLARIAGYSKFHFLRIFKQNTGQRVHEYINEVRIKKVNEMLKEGYMKKEISDKLGFSCPISFANWYRKIKNADFYK